MRVVICIRRPHFHKWTKCLGHGTFLICIILLPWHQSARRSPGIEFLANFDRMLFFPPFPQKHILILYTTMPTLHLLQYHCAEVNDHYLGVQYYINCNWLGDKDRYQSESVSHAHSTGIDVYEFSLESWKDLGRHHHGICHCCSGSSSQVSTSTT